MHGFARVRQYCRGSKLARMRLSARVRLSFAMCRMEQRSSECRQNPKNSKMKKIYMAGPSITEHEINIVNDAMRNGWYENAYQYVEKFQSEFAQYHDRKFGIMTPNCTTAIHLLLTALGIKDGDEVIVPECTW